MQFIEIGKLKSKQSEFKLDLILDVFKRHHEQKGLDQELHTNDFHALSCVLNVPSSDVRTIYKGFKKLLINPKKEN